jgi:hypothetical protein
MSYLHDPKGQNDLKALKAYVDVCDMKICLLVCVSPNRHLRLSASFFYVSHKQQDSTKLPQGTWRALESQLRIERLNNTCV